MLRAARSIVKESALFALGSKPAVRLKLAAIARSRALTVLNLHRVAPYDGSSYPPLNPALFESLIVFVKRHFEVVTFGTMDRPNESGRPKLILSFDDGYADFAVHAAPILERHGIRVNHNVIPACVESGLPPLNVLLQDFVGKAAAEALDRLDIPGFAFDAERETRISIGNRLSSFIKSKPIAAQERLARVVLPAIQGQPGFEPTPMMTLEQISEIAATHEIGAHSFAHASLAHETDDYVRDDVEHCRVWMAAKLDLPLYIYAVPNGSYRPEQIELLRTMGVRQILLVDENFSVAGNDVHRRFTFDAHSAHEAMFRATGGFRWPRRPAAMS